MSLLRADENCALGIDFGARRRFFVCNRVCLLSRVQKQTGYSCRRDRSVVSVVDRIRLLLEPK